MVNEMKKNMLTIFCLCLHNNFFNQLKKLKYIPVGLGNNFFNSKFLRDNTKNNISKKNKYYGEYTFHYWFWKNKLKDFRIKQISDNKFIVEKLHNDIIAKGYLWWKKL